MGPGVFRYFLAVAVLVNHVSRLSIGETAVYVFFVLSGYWITLMWESKYSATDNPYFIYLISRLWRLLPVFWLCGLLCLAVEPWAAHVTGSLLHFWGSQLVILGYNTMSFWPNGPAWSLDIELQFYLLAPLLIWRMSWQLLLAVAAVALAASLKFGTSLVSLGIFFAIGIYGAKYRWRPGRLLMTGCAAAIAIIIGVSLAIPNLNSLILVGAHPGPLSKWNDAVQVVLSLLAIPFAIHTTGHKSGRIDKLLADASYTLYLVHWPLLQWAGAHRLIGREMQLAVVFLTSVVFSIFLAACFDAPIQRLRQRWLRAQMRTRTVNSPLTHQSMS